MVSSVGNGVIAPAFRTTLPPFEELSKTASPLPEGVPKRSPNYIRPDGGRRMAEGSAPTRAPTDAELKPDRPARKKTEIQMQVGNDGRITGTPLDLTSKLLVKNQGVFIGEKHSDSMARDFLRTNMPSLKSQGVKAVFLECIEKKNQGLINAFYDAKTPANEQKALARLESALEATWGHDPKGYVDLIQSAKTNGVRVFGIDERNGPFSGRVPEDNTRGSTWRNQFWARTTNEVMSKQFNNRDKFVLLGGNAHAAGKLSYATVLEGDGQKSVPTYGADYALQIPSIRFNSSQDTKLPPGSYPTNRTPFSLADVDYYVIGEGRESKGMMKPSGGATPSK